MRMPALSFAAMGANAVRVHYLVTMEEQMRNDIESNAQEKAPLAAIELGRNDLEAISGGISEETREALETLRKELLQKAAQAAREDRPDAANAYSDAMESIAASWRALPRMSMENSTKALSAGPAPCCRPRCGAQAFGFLAMPLIPIPIHNVP